MRARDPMVIIPLLLHFIRDHALLGLDHRVVINGVLRVALLRRRHASGARRGTSVCLRHLDRSRDKANRCVLDKQSVAWHEHRGCSSHAKGEEGADEEGEHLEGVGSHSEVVCRSKGSFC